jgi:ribosome biogenesis GTPase A|tara:strand:- start:58 stop:468 length:411 start_codon:yes stop_codon:yes gene_type:complete
MKITKSHLRRLIKEELNKVLRSEAREDHIGDIERRLDKSRRRAGYELEPGGIGQTDRAQRQFYREDPDIGFDNHSNDPGDDSPESGAYWDSVDKAEQDWINDRAKNALLPDEKRERADLLNKIARLEKELAHLKTA